MEKNIDAVISLAPSQGIKDKVEIHGIYTVKIEPGEVGALVFIPFYEGIVEDSETFSLGDDCDGKPVIKYSIKKKADGDTDGVYLLK